MRRKDVASTSFRRHVPTRFLLNQFLIKHKSVFNKAFLILKSYVIQNSRIELRGIVLPVPSNQIKTTFIIILPFSLVHLRFFQFLIEIEGQCRWIIGGGGGGGGGGGRRVCWLPSKIVGGLTPLFLHLCGASSILAFQKLRLPNV